MRFKYRGSACGWSVPSNILRIVTVLSVSFYRPDYSNCDDCGLFHKSPVGFRFHVSGLVVETVNFGLIKNRLMSCSSAEPFV